MRVGTQDKDFLPVDLYEKFNLLKEMGFSCFEADGKMLVEQTGQLLEASKKADFPVVSACGGYRGWIGDFIEERRLNGIEDIKAIMQALKKVGGHGVVLPAAWGMFTYRLPPMTSPRSTEGDKKAIMASLDALDAEAGNNGISIYLEPLNRYQDHMLNTLEDASRIIAEGKYKNVKILFDFYHMAIEEDNMDESLVNYKELIGHIHIAENHRYEPGTGSIDFEKHFHTLRQIGYTGDIVYEGRVRGEDPLNAYKKSIKYISALVKGVSR